MKLTIKNIVISPNLRDGMNGNFVSLSVCFLYSRVVCVLVGNEERCLNVTAIRIFTLSIENFFVKFNVIVVDGIIEGNCDHLRYISGRQVTRDDGTIFRAKTVWQHTLAWVTWRSSIRIVIDI
jgi:hypothetical protein